MRYYERETCCLITVLSKSPYIPEGSVEGGGVVTDTPGGVLATKSADHLLLVHAVCDTRLQGRATDEIKQGRG